MVEALSFLREPKDMRNRTGNEVAPALWRTSSKLVASHSIARPVYCYLNFFRNLRHFPDGTDFPSDQELKRGVDINLVLEGHLHEALNGIVNNPHEMSSMYLYEGLIIHIVMRDGMQHWQVQQRMPGEGVRTIIAPGQSSGFGNLREESVYSRVK